MAAHRVLVTAGPTREWYDSVRFLTNASTGKMGYAMARAARDRGFEVTLVSGPVQLRPVEGVKTVPIESARDLRKAVLALVDGVDTVIMAAAVSDYRPARRVSGKLSKRRGGPGAVGLVPNPDILKELGKRRGRPTLVGFALEAADLERRAKAKLRDKRLDWIVANGPDALGSGRSSVLVLGSDGQRVEIPEASKATVARRLIHIVCP